MSMVVKFIYSMKSNREISSLEQNEGGFSLVELIFVMLFLGIALATTLSMVSTGVTKSMDSESMSLATTLAEQKMEEIRGDKNGRGYFYVTNSNYDTETNAGGYAGFTRTTTITTYSSYKEITVSVAKEDMPTVTLVTFLTNY